MKIQLKSCWKVELLKSGTRIHKLLLETEGLNFQVPRFPKTKTNKSFQCSEEGCPVLLPVRWDVIAILPLCHSAWSYLTLRVCTPSPQFSRMFTKVTLQTLHGSVTHMYWWQSLWHGTTSYTWNTHLVSQAVEGEWRWVDGRHLYHHSAYSISLVSFLPLTVHTLISKKDLV